MRHKAEFQQEHLGEWVITHDSETERFSDDHQEAAQVALTRIGRGPHPTRKIGIPNGALAPSVLNRPVNANHSLWIQQESRKSVQVALRAPHLASKAGKDKRNSPGAFRCQATLRSVRLRCWNQVRTKLALNHEIA